MGGEGDLGEEELDQTEVASSRSSFWRLRRGPREEVTPSECRRYGAMPENNEGP